MFPRELINNNENILNLLLRSRETDITNKLEMKESEVLGLQNDLKSARDKIRNLQTDIKELSDGRHQQSEATDREGMEERLSELRVKLQQTQLDLDCKDKVLRDATERLEFSNSRLGKMEEFLNSQQLRIVSLENTVQETEKVTDRVRVSESDNISLLRRSGPCWTSCTRPGGRGRSPSRR